MCIYYLKLGVLHCVFYLKTDNCEAAGGRGGEGLSCWLQQERDAEGS